MSAGINKAIIVFKTVGRICICCEAENAFCRVALGMNSVILILIVTDHYAKPLNKQIYNFYELEATYAVVNEHEICFTVRVTRL